MAEPSERSSAVRSFPVAAVTVVLALTLGLLGGLVWYVLDSYRYFKTTHHCFLQVRELTGRIVHLDEILTMSARMAATTGDLRWEERYRHHEPQLDAAIKEMYVLGEQFALQAKTAKTDKANANLVAMESRAFDLVRRGQLKDAASVLSGAEYEKQKELYRLGIEETTAAINERLRRDYESQNQKVRIAVVSVVVAAPLLVFSWVVVIRLARRYNAERRKIEKEREQGVERLRKALGATIRAIAHLVETRDPCTAGHQKRVSDLARSIATEMGLESGRIEGLRIAGMIHNLGKIVVPAEILSKPTKLTDIEFSLIRNHVQAGYDILKDTEFPWPVARMVFEHHERADGSGYPEKISGREVLMESKILTVADVVEAMASHRPYRPGLGLAAALDEIAKNKGGLYEPDVVDACLKLFSEKGYRMAY